MSPVLLDHRKLKWIWLSVGLLAFLTFLGGYILGFEKSNTRWMAKLNPLVMPLPGAMASAVAVVEAEPPATEEPGARIDVDSADDIGSDQAVADNPDAYTGIVAAIEISSAQAAPAQPASTKRAEPGAGQTEKEPASAAPADRTASIVEDASADTANYAIQVGMYSSFENAEARVSQLLNSNLNAYLNEYQNKKDETRYNVRFGYFASFASAQQALNIYQMSEAGTGYIARIER